MKRIVIVCSALMLAIAVPMPAQQAGDQYLYQYWLSGESSPFGATPIETQIVKGVPYSAEVVSESVQTLADGNRIVQRKTARVYRDGQGRVRREEDRPSGPPTVSIMDPVAGTAFTLDAANRTARQTPPVLYTFTTTSSTDTTRLQSYELSVAGIPIREAQTGYRTRRGGDAVEEKLPDRSIEGVLATGVRRTTTIAKGAIGNEQPIKIVSEEWTSPELQVLVLTDHSDPRTGRSTYRLLKISRLEPDPALFQAPADYTIQRFAGRGRGR
jgi:hypothetical protein